jgi:hypothetical protein
MIFRLSSKSITCSFATLVAFTLSLFVSIPIYAQVIGATLSGTVLDTSGAAIPNAKLSIRNTATGVTRDVTTDSVGFYSAPNILPGNYEITTSATGFSTRVQTGITLAVGAQQVLNITMQIGQVTEKVEVTGEAPTVELASSSIAALVNSTAVQELPLNGRDWSQLATLQPGVTTAASLQAVPTAAGRGFRGYGAQLAVSGTRPQWNVYRFDGISVNDYSNSGPGSVSGTVLGVDAIQEFSVSTSNYSAEYGRTAGGVISAISKAGTNQFHGDAYEFLRNSALDARNFFDGPKVPTFRRNQFGVSAGGPIRKDRTFVFGDYEGLRQFLGATQVVNVPSSDARNGILHNADGTTTIVTVDPSVRPFLAIWPSPVGQLLAPGNIGVFSFVNNDVTSENFVTVRFDHKISEKDSLFGSYQHDKDSLTLPDSLHTLIEGSSTTRQFVTLQESHIFSPRVLNSVRVGFNRFSADLLRQIAGITPVATDKSLAAVPGQNAPAVSVPGLTAFAGGLGSTTSANFHFNSFQGYDDFFFTKGVHEFKLGFAVERIQDNMFESPGTGGGFTFGTLAGFLTNQPVSFTAGLTQPLGPRGLRQTNYGGYFQDDIRWRPNLTVNLGLRYEMATVITEVQGKLQALRNITDVTPIFGGPLYSNPTLRNFQPRVGFAWDPFRNGRTAIRGGFGIFDVLPLPYEFELSQVIAYPWNFQESAVNLSQGTFPSGAFPSLQLANITLNFVQPKPRRNYVMQYNFSTQRELVRNLTMTLSYVGSRGIHNNFTEDNANSVLPTLTSAGYIWPSPIGSGTVINPAHARINSLTWPNNSFYNALQAQVIKKMSHGFQVQGSYTWGKSIDEGSTAVAGDQFSNSINNLFPFDRRLRRGLSDFNVGQTLVINYVWNVPTPESLKGSAAFWAVGGWELGGIFQVHSGLPFTPLIAGDPLGQKLAGNNPAYPNRIKTSDCNSAINPSNVGAYIKLNCFTLPISTPAIAAQCVPFSSATVQGSCKNLLGNAGRNSLIGPGFEELDFSIIKNTYIKKVSESFNTQFRAEVFNLLNRPNFSLPNNTLFDANGGPLSTAGSITAASASTSRQIQFALKVIW